MSNHTNTFPISSPWLAPVAVKPLDATMQIPGSKSLSNRYLILAALGSKPVTLEGILRSRDTELMMDALTTLGVQCIIDERDSTIVTVIPPADRKFVGNTSIYCGLAGTVMRFVPAIALYADGPVRFDGDEQAYKRPMKPVLDGLEQLGAEVIYHGVEGFLPFTLIPPSTFDGDKNISIDSSSSSQFISGLLLAASTWNGEVTITHTGEKLPSMPHIRMTMDDISKAGGQVEYSQSLWKIPTRNVQLHSHIVVEPDLSNAAPFVCAALIAGGEVRIARWPAESTQPGALLPQYLRLFGAQVEYDSSAHILSVHSDGIINGAGMLDLSPAGEIAPTLAAVAALANSDTTFTGISHLRGHETDRLKALVTEIKRFGGNAEETSDGLKISSVARNQLHGEVMETYADHRMATFAAMIGLVVPNTYVVNIETTRKTIPDFVHMWMTMLA
ncbi:3-phosphoshikimate 1-carboxyvinyltransferase [Alloscardovia theropitheci]|uniref:3-phosphoshikimate 1-carboxyvinyltransferase n=1 Tax=Alloscardovia theropitheci TaxID=2496842 RepID=A0A4R0QU28_9BIFI|nr:3-phosphoshikimate 1-carboxyvinyltransferase [Alloscardovia theropitheci]TCD54865.1 3-phosphoshikimate 1-carboxyvinyltransferase [Alloscardovia theropitheci]